MHPLDGIIILDKPVGITSAKALYRVRSITRQRKSGHAGTLDPAASGVLVLCQGKATKLVEAIMEQPKVYRTTARLDVTSESFDHDGTVVPVEVAVPPSVGEVRDALRSMEGVMDQVPPLVSAVKVGGVPAYKRFRLGEQVTLRPRPVRIDWIHVHSYRWPEIDFEMCCGRGTYVRALIRDLGEKLGTGGCLRSLVRLRVGPFVREAASTFESMENAKSVDDYTLDLDTAREWLDPDALVVPARPTTD